MSEKITTHAMQTFFYPAGSRGHADHGWLNAFHSFSFAGYYNPLRMHFGALRVLNDDTVEGGQGFGMHPHDNMEIVTIPLEGALEHKDSMGNSSVINAGDVQVMSAGTGVYHSEFNHFPDRPVKLLQVWVFPNEQGVKPRYDQRTFDPKEFHNTFKTIVSDNDPEAMYLHQHAAFSIGELEKGTTTSYKVKHNGNGIYVFVISGVVTIGENTLGKRDAVGITETTSIDVSTSENAKVLLIEVPMTLG